MLGVKYPQNFTLKSKTKFDQEIIDKIDWFKNTHFKC